MNTIIVTKRVIIATNKLHDTPYMKIKQGEYYECGIQKSYEKDKSMPINT